MIAAGGIADAIGIKAALAPGALAVQVGTALLANKEVQPTQDHKDKLFSSDSAFTTLNKLFTGRLALRIDNCLTQELKGKRTPQLPTLYSIILSAR